MPLTDRGEDQARALRSVLDGGTFTSVWSSDLRRAVETSRLAWGSATPDARLRECNFGIWEGRPFDEVDATDARVFLEFRDFDMTDGDKDEEILMDE